jgi:U3 small nucleolar RNA-associated protein MPP10
MDAKIKEIEEELVKEKDWQLKGETSSKQRPVNSLLEEVLEFDYAAKPAPVITEQVTNSLDELIKQRILNNSFDDLVRKYEEKRYSNERQIVDDSLSRKPESLAKVYEDEFRKEAASASGVVEGPKKTKEHLEIEQALQKLSYKLNSLSNFHYTPKPAKLELRVNPIEISTIEMEEAIPVAVSNEKLLAPQEMHKSAKNERELKTQEELDSKDKKILRTNAKKRRSKNKPKAPQQSVIEAK